MYTALTAPSAQIAKLDRTCASDGERLSKSDPVNLSRHPKILNLSNSNSYSDINKWVQL